KSPSPTTSDFGHPPVRCDRVLDDVKVRPPLPVRKSESQTDVHDPIPSHASAGVDSKRATNTAGKPAGGEGALADRPPISSASAVALEFLRASAHLPATLGTDQVSNRRYALCADASQRRVDQLHTLLANKSLPPFENQWRELIDALYRSAYGCLAVFGADLVCVASPAGAQAID